MKFWGICNNGDRGALPKKIFFRKGQNLAEVALIIGVLGLVLIGMQVYVKRGLQGKVKDLTDIIISGGSEKQAAYQQDTSGFEINDLTSTLVSDTRVTVKESEGGGRRSTGSETTTYEYESTLKGK